MPEYPKIQTVFKRDPDTKFKTLLIGEFATPEFQFLAHNEWEFTEKVDGTNIRVGFDGEKITFRGKTDKAQIPAPLLNNLNEIFLPKLSVFKSIFDSWDAFTGAQVCLCGEGYGAKIQKGGGNYLPYQSFVLFDIKIGKWWLERRDVLDITQKLNSTEAWKRLITVVPLIGKGTLHEMVEIARDGFQSQWGVFLAEGIVARPSTTLMARDGSRIITKIKHKDFGTK